MQDWVALHDAFMRISRANADYSKSGEGYLGIKLLPRNYWNDDQEKTKPYILLEFGGYQIGDWSRHHEFGPFMTMDEAWLEGVKRVREAYDTVNSDMREEGKQILFYPSILL